MASYKIGVLAQATGITVEAIRYYEREGLLPPPGRSDGNYRVYGEAHLSRLHFIRHCRSLDMALGDIRTLLDFRDHPQRSCAGVNQLLDQHMDDVAERINQLQALQQQLATLRSLCGQERSAHDCAILQCLDT